MSEEENKQEETTTEGKEEAVPDTSEGDKPAEGNLIDRADALNKGLDEKLKRFASLVERQEATTARTMLAGHVEAGSVSETPEEIKDKAEEAEAKALVDNYLP